MPDERDGASLDWIPNVCLSGAFIIVFVLASFVCLLFFSLDTPEGDLCRSARRRGGDMSFVGDDWVMDGTSTTSGATLDTEMEKQQGARCDGRDRTAVAANKCLKILQRCPKS